ncbi:TRPT1 [Symbiodinium natans]|uniref:2'-phosphotransferase n=1 Tax=Symbiodinium natans TaxID=878477 RepID=A0A812JNX7_9DINO|nr:TRPT1 [Symbiodinium natans]
MVEMDYIIELSEPEEDTEQDTVPIPAHNRNLTAVSAQAASSRRHREDPPQPASGERPTASKRGEPPRPPLARRRKTAISKALTDVLRHSGARHGLEVRADALFDLRAVLDTHKLKALHAQEHEILQVVEESDKKRFEVVRREGAKWIRAAQGHSMEGIDNSTFQVRVPRRLLPQELYHGTYDDAYSQIVQSGLLAGGPSRKRNDIHLTEGLPTDRPISGMRNTCNIALAILPKEAAAEGCTFYKSGNQVYLTKGIGTQKVLPARFIHAVIILKSGERILSRTADGPPSLRDVHAGLLRANDGMRANRAKINAGSLIPRHTATEPRCIPVHSVHLSKWMSPAKLLCKAAMPETTTSLLLSMEWQWQTSDGTRATDGDAQGWGVNVMNTQAATRRTQSMEGLLNELATGVAASSRRKEAKRSTPTTTTSETSRLDLRETTHQEAEHPSSSFQTGSDRKNTIVCSPEGQLIPHGDDLHTFLNGYFRRHHATYHANPVNMPSCGNWIWSLTAALMTRPEYHPNVWRRSHAGKLGDAVEGYLYTLYQSQTAGNLALLATYGEAAKYLHDLMQGIPHAIYYRLSWRQSLDSLTEILEPWIGAASTQDMRSSHPVLTLAILDRNESIAVTVEAENTGLDKQQTMNRGQDLLTLVKLVVSTLHPWSAWYLEPMLTTLKKQAEPPLTLDLLVAPQTQMPAAPSQGLGEQEANPRSTAARRSNTNEPRPEARQRSSAARRASTVEPRPHLLLAQAPEEVRHAKQRLLQEAKSAVVKLIPHGDDLHNFLHGYFRQHHATYHTSPMNMPACGNWIWSLTAALMTRPESHPNVWTRRQAGKLGDAVEGYLYTLYQKQTVESLALLAIYGEAARHLHDLMQGIPHAIYYRLSWRQSLDTLEELLEPWIGVSDAQVANGDYDRPSDADTYEAGGGAQQRLKVLSINVNSLSGFLWGEVKAFLGGEGLQYDFIFLQETHRTAFCAFKVDNWMAVGSSTKRGEGVLTLVHPRYDASMVRYQEIIPGRVLRVKVCHKEAAIETLNIYQHVWIHTDDPEQNKQRRQTLLDKCTATIQGMARRDTLILAGDFNSEVHAVNGLIGTRVNRSAYHQALDPLTLPRFIQDNALVALNTWHMKDPCTNHTRTGNSQIDYILVRAPSADTRAKQVVKQEAPFGAWKELTHSALIADVRIIKHFHLPKAKMQQELQYSRHDLDYAYRQKDHRITQLKSKVELEINHSLNHGLPLTADHINHTLLREVSDLFPTATSAHTNRGQTKAQCKAIFAAWKELLTHPDEVGGSTITLPARVYHMWQRRRDLQRCKPFTLSGVLRTWQWVLLFNKAGRQSKQYHLQHQRAIALGHLQQAERAAQTHNTKRLYGAVKRLLPWKPKPRIMLKHPDGSPMSLHQEHQALVQHCKQLFAPPAASPTRPGQMLSMPLTACEWTTQLKCTPIGKAVPADSAPATAWKACATIVAPAMACIAKGLLRPDGKAFAGHIKNQLLMQACANLTHTPQYAYLPARDTSDALARVNACIHDIKDGLKALGGNRFLTRQRKETGQVKGESGGCLLSVDLSQAFDRVNRAKLDRALALHQVDADLRSTVTAIHEQAAYQVRDKFHRTDICTTQGIRQGCRLAPALWAVLSSQLLWDLTPAGQTPLQLPFTLFADDHLGHWLLKTVDDAKQMEETIVALFHMLETYGLKVNPDKSSLVIRVQGAQLEKFVKSRTVIVRNQVSNQTLRETYNLKDPVHMLTERIARKLDAMQQGPADRRPPLHLRPSSLQYGLYHTQGWTLRFTSNHLLSSACTMTSTSVETTPEQQMAAVWGLSSPLATTPTPQRQASVRHRLPQGTPQKYRKGMGKGAGKAAPKAKRDRDQDAEDELMMDLESLDEETVRTALKTLVKTALRHEHQLTILEADRSYVFFLDTTNHGIVSMLIQASATWNTKFEEGTVNTSLRATLWGVLLMEWKARLEKIESDAKVLQVAETAGWATRSPLQWIYNEWNPVQKKALPSSRDNLTHEDAKKAVNQLITNTAKDNTVHRFQSLRPLKPDLQAEVITMVLTLTVHQQAAAVYHDLDLLANNCAGKLIGLRLRRERVGKTTLTKELERLQI